MYAPLESKGNGGSVCVAIFALGFESAQHGNDRSNVCRDLLQSRSPPQVALQASSGPPTSAYAIADADRDKAKVACQEAEQTQQATADAVVAAAEEKTEPQ